MGAKQSKRSVDISGKEAESAGEVAAAGAGGEGRVEQLADADALKPQLNGDAHIHEKSENEKELDSGTPENEKDATTEKEAKASEEEKDREPVANGEPEQKTDNGDTAPTPEEGKKPKKEKVKKKFSLRSISFSRKDKPKQEKKRKDEEPKTNGEPDKVPEETAEATTPAVVVNDVPEDKTEIETKEKTPETPVTEPITNGSSTPESLKVESENSIKASLENDKPEPKPEQEPEQLDLNGLSLEEHNIETPDVENKIAEIVEIKNEEQVVEKTPEIAPSPENPVKEVCVDQMPLIEPTPPPLPANPPPSSVASFAATTMAPELADASLPNTAENAMPESPPTPPLKSDEVHVEPSILPTNTEILTDLTTKEPTENDVVPMQIDKPEEVLDNIPSAEVLDSIPSVEILDNISSPKVLENIPIVEVTDVVEIDSTSLVSENNANTDCTNQLDNQVVIIPDDNQIVEPSIESSHSDLHVVNIAPVDESSQIAVEKSISCSDNDNAPTVNEDIDSVEKSEIPVESNGLEINSNHVISNNGTTDILDQEMNAKPHEEKLDNVSDLIENLPEVVECNGNVEENNDNGRTGECAIETTSGSGTVVDSEKDSIAEEQLPSAPQLAEAEAEAEAETPSATPPPPSPPSPMEPPQEPMPICDKMADLIPEIPTVPELQTETLQETPTDVTVAN